MADSGFAVAWRAHGPCLPVAPGKCGYIETAWHDSAGRFRASSQEIYPDSPGYGLTAPRLSAFPGGGALYAWSIAPGHGLPAKAMLRSLGPTDAPREAEAEFPGADSVFDVNVLALADGGYVLGAAGKDSGGVPALWSRSFTAAGHPRGAEWKRENAEGIRLAPGYSLLPDGGWMLFWIRGESGRNTVAWQRFGPDGNPQGKIGTGPEAPSARPAILSLSPWIGGRILARMDSAAFLVSPDGEWAPLPGRADARAAGPLAADTTRRRIYGVSEGALARWDDSLRVQARGPELGGLDLSGFRISVLANGRLACVARESAGGKTTLSLRIFDPF
jgi:hypothetical protein